MTMNRLVRNLQETQKFGLSLKRKCIAVQRIITQKMFYGVWLSKIVPVHLEDKKETLYSITYHKLDKAVSFKYHLKYGLYIKGSKVHQFPKLYFCLTDTVNLFGEVQIKAF